MIGIDKKLMTEARAAARIMLQEQQQRATLPKSAGFSVATQEPSGFLTIGSFEVEGTTVYLLQSQ